MPGPVTRAFDVTAAHIPTTDPIPAPEARLTNMSTGDVQIEWGPVFELIAALPPGAAREIQVPSNVKALEFIGRLRANLYNNKRTRDCKWSVFSKGHDSVWVKRDVNAKKGEREPERLVRQSETEAGPETVEAVALDFVNGIYNTPAAGPVNTPPTPPSPPVATTTATATVLDEPLRDGLTKVHQIRKVQLADRIIEYQVQSTIPELLLNKLPDFCGDWETPAMEKWLEAYETVSRLILERVPVNQPTVKTMIR